MHLIGVVMRPLGIELILDMDAGDPGGSKFAHRAHRVQRLAEPGAGIGDQRHLHSARHLAGDAHLLVHRQQRLGDHARGAGDIAAGVDDRHAHCLGEAAFERRRRRGHVKKLTAVEQFAQPPGLFAHPLPRHAVSRATG